MENSDYNNYKKSERGFTKFDKDSNLKRNLQEHHFARIFMMKQEEKGIFISYEEAIKQTKTK